MELSLSTKKESKEAFTTKKPDNVGIISMNKNITKECSIVYLYDNLRFLLVVLRTDNLEESFAKLI